MAKLQSKELAIQKLTLEFENHQKQDALAFTELKTLLKSIDNKLDIMSINAGLISTKMAVLESQFNNHLKGHDEINKEKDSSIRNGLYAIAIVTLVLNVVGFVIQHSLK